MIYFKFNNFRFNNVSKYNDDILLFFIFMEIKKINQISENKNWFFNEFKICQIISGIKSLNSLELNLEYNWNNS